MEHTKKISRKTKREHKTLTGWLFIAPAFICFLLFLLIPAIMAVVMSFTSYNGFTAMKFIGIDNYTRLFQDTYPFWIPS